MASIAKARGPQLPQLMPLCVTTLCAALLSCGTPSADAVGEGGDEGVVVLLPREPQEIDPRFAGDLYGMKVSRLLFASLVRIDPTTLEAVPDLAEWVHLLGPRQYRVRLRPGLRFSDGSPLSTRDVKATFEGVIDPHLGSRYASTYRRIERIELRDAREVDFFLRDRHATFLTDLELPIVRATDARLHLGARDGPPPTGAGPYVLTHRDTGLLRLAPNPHWHGGMPRIPRVTLRVIRDDNTRALRMLAGSGDLVVGAIPPLLLPLFEHAEGLSIHSAPGISTSYLGIQTERSPLSDPRVRRAIALSIDRRLIVDTKLGGRATLARSPIPEGHWAQLDTLKQIPHDPDTARRLLAEAGHARGLRLTLRCGSDRFRVSMARAIAAMLRDVGIEVRVRPSEVATLIADLNRGRFELTLLQLPEVIEPHVLSWFFGSDHIPEGGVEGANRWRLRDPALDAALERGRTHVERGARKRAYAQVQRRLQALLPVIPLWHEDVVQVSSARADGVPVARNARLDLLAR